MAAAVFGAGCAAVAVGLAGLVITVAALTRRLPDDIDDDWPRWAVELGGPEALLGEVSG